LSGVGFADPDGLPVDDSIAQFVLADVVFSESGDKIPLQKDRVMACVHSGSFFLIVPLPESCIDGSEQEIYRIGFNVPGDEGSPPSRPPLSYLQEHLNAIGPLKLSSDSTVNP
jgi:hypothetical protein